MTASKSEWTLVASEPDDQQPYDEDTTTSTEPSNNAARRRVPTLAAWRARHSLLGWEFGVKLGLLTIVLIFILNVAMTGGVVDYYGVDDMGKASLATGSYDSIRRSNTTYHLFINILSTLLIGPSNYTM